VCRDFRDVSRHQPVLAHRHPHANRDRGSTPAYADARVTENDTVGGSNEVEQSGDARKPTGPLMRRRDHGDPGSVMPHRGPEPVGAQGRSPACGRYAAMGEQNDADWRQILHLGGAPSVLT
jgi:hypothetical protein